jgi:chemotaxis methyl-accepting protein methylase
MENTAGIRSLLPELVENYRIESVHDAGAGDLHWIQHIEWRVRYQGFDLVPRHADVQRLDITKDIIPPCDLILCRFVLGHMDPESAQRAVRLFRLADAKYLLASNPESVDYAKDLYGTFNKWDLRLDPFNLGEPLETYPDCGDHNLCLWKL